LAGTDAKTSTAAGSRRKRTATRNTGAQAAARDMICGAALKLFADGGFNAVSMRTIAHELGVSAMMPYSYFASKDHLLLELRTRAFQRLADRLRLARLDGENALEAFDAVCRAYLGFAEDEPGSYRLMFDFWALESGAVGDAELREATLRQSGALAEIQVAIAAIGAECDPEVEAPLVWAALHGFASLILIRHIRGGRLIEQLADPVIDMLVQRLTGRLSV